MIWKHATKGAVEGEVVAEDERWVTVRLDKPLKTGIRRYEPGEEVPLLKVMLTEKGKG